MNYSESKSERSLGLRVPGVEEKVAFLSDPHSYDPSFRQIDVRETHMSWVFLTDGLAFKLKKPVRFPYLDFTTIEKRAAASRAEVALNRRLASDVLIYAVPLCVSPAGLSVGKGAGVVDWLVKMRPLDQNRMLDHLIASQAKRPFSLNAWSGGASWTGMATFARNTSGLATRSRLSTAWSSMRGCACWTLWRRSPTSILSASTSA